MPNYFSRVMHPEWYHGHHRKPPFFEGWYYKFVNHAETARYAIIPGVFLHKEPHQTHAFVQVLDGTAGKAYYHAFQNFEAAKDRFEVRVGQNFFQADRITLHIDDEIGCIQGELIFNHLTPYPVSWSAPGIMGWYGWLPFMECNHGVVSLNHEVSGTLTIYGQTYDFTGGKGYTEKDWGQSFPTGYIWMQTNHFDDASISLTASIATIPNLGRVFPGFIVAVLHQNTLYRFTTYNNTRVGRLVVTETEVDWVLYNHQHELTIHAQRADGAPLRGPEKTAMHKRVDETMLASADIALYELAGTRKRLIFQGHGRNMGLEVVGDLRLLLQS